MATVYQTLMPGSAILRTTAFPQFVQANGTNIPVAGLAFDGGSSDEACFWRFSALNYGSGNITVTIEWYADTASSGNVRWGAQIACITPNTDTQDIETDALATATEGNDAHLGTTAQRLHSFALTVTNLDSIAADDDVALRLYREASDTGNDTMTGDAIVTKVIVSYSDS